MPPTAAHHERQAASRALGIEAAQVREGRARAPLQAMQELPTLRVERRRKVEPTGSAQEGGHLVNVTQGSEDAKQAGGGGALGVLQQIFTAGLRNVK